MDLQSIIRNIPNSQLYDLISTEQYQYIKNRNEHEYTNKVFQITDLVKLIGKFKGEMEKAEDIKKLNNNSGYKFILKQVWELSLNTWATQKTTSWRHTRYLDTNGDGKKTKTRLKGKCEIYRTNNVFYVNLIFNRFCYKKRLSDKQYLMSFQLKAGGGSSFNEKILDCLYNKDELLKWL